MRGRGGRGGRGRGRSITQDLVRDNLDDLGLQISSGDDNNEPQKNFPHISISTPVHPAGERVFLIEKCRDIVYRFERSHSFLAKNTEQDHISISMEDGRFSDLPNGSIGFNGNKRTIDMMQYIQEEGIDSSKYISAELIEQAKIEHPSLPSSSLGTKRRKDINLGRLERQEKIEKAAKNTEIEAGSDLEAVDGDEQDEDLDDDYGVDHYADSDGGGDISDDGHGEAVF